MRWWCKQWNRPMKDPLLQTYTFEELIYEYHSVIEHDRAAVERAQQENDKIEEAKHKAAEDWADQMEAEESKDLDPAKDPENIKWMEEQLAKDKEAFGEDFGEDLNVDFNSSKK